MTYSSVTTNYANYYQIGKFVWYSMEASGTLGGTPSYGVRFTAPVNMDTTNKNVAAGGFTDGGSTKGAAVVEQISTTTMEVRRYDVGNFSAGSARVIAASGFYKAA